MNVNRNKRQGVGNWKIIRKINKDHGIMISSAGMPRIGFAIRFRRRYKLPSRLLILALHCQRRFGHWHVRSHDDIESRTAVIVSLSQPQCDQKDDEDGNDSDDIVCKQGWLWACGGGRYCILDLLMVDASTGMAGGKQ